jgi:outer membrane protein with beta-barrel domain
MSILRKSSLMVALVVVLSLIPGAASAQEPRIRVSFAPSMAAVGGDAELAMSGTAAYRFSEHFWFEGDLTWIDAAAGGLRDRDFEIPFPIAFPTDFTELIRRYGSSFGPNMSALPVLGNLTALPIFPIYPGRFSASVDGSTFIATVGVRYELPTQTARFRPYLSGGLGVNNTEQEVRIELLGIDTSASRTGFAFDGGAGASIRVWRQLWADMDAKYFRLSGDRDIMRLGGGVSYRF